MGEGWGGGEDERGFPPHLSPPPHRGEDMWVMISPGGEGTKDLLLSEVWERVAARSSISDRRGGEMNYAKIPLDNNRDNDYITIRYGG